jgi:hypothetical protein
MLLGFLLVVLVVVGIQIYIRKSVVERADKDSSASHPGRIKPHRGLLRDLSPGLYPHSLSPKIHREALRVRIFIARQLWHGASNPAVVIEENPYIVAAYAADCDAVLLVRLLPETVEDAKKRGISFRPGARLLSVNTYFPPGTQHKNEEIVLGPQQSGLFASFRPFLAEFMSHDIDTIERRKREIPERLWERTARLGHEKRRDCDVDRLRWANPWYVEIPKSYLLAIDHAEAWDMPY